MDGGPAGSVFGAGPSVLSGAGAAYVRGEGPLPAGAVWLGADRAPAGGWLRLALAGSVAGLAVAAVWGQPVTAGVALLAGGLSWWRLSRRERHGILLLADRLVVVAPGLAGVVCRKDAVGIERRVRGQDAVYAVVLAGRTGRGAVVAPVAGEAAGQALTAWLAGAAPVVSEQREPG